MTQAFEQLKQQYLRDGIRMGEERGEAKGRKIGEIKGILQTMKEYGSLKENAVEKMVKRYPKDQELVFRLADEIFAN